MRGKFLFLGSGGSAGVPIIGCSCSVCTSSSPFNHRLRPSGLFCLENKFILLDASPDLRQQALRACLHRVDALLLTHPHFDHIGGLDELRAFSFFQMEKIPCLLSIATFEELKMRYHYLIHPSHGHPEKSYCAQISFHPLESDFGEVFFAGVSWRVLSYHQGHTLVTGYRCGNLAYVSDIRHYPERIFEELQGVETLILSAHGYLPSSMHFSLSEAIEFSQKVGAQKTFLTHIGHDLDHEKTSTALPPSVFLSYDGLGVFFDY
jgi:phosphoribosyl 1,2-cyclic phosphate phosphodiesterase